METTMLHQSPPTGWSTASRLPRVHVELQAQQTHNLCYQHACTGVAKHVTGDTSTPRGACGGTKDGILQRRKNASTPRSSAMRPPRQSPELSTYRRLRPFRHAGSRRASQGPGKPRNEQQLAASLVDTRDLEPSRIDSHQSPTRRRIRCKPKHCVTILNPYGTPPRLLGSHSPRDHAFIRWLNKDLWETTGPTNPSNGCASTTHCPGQKKNSSPMTAGSRSR